jgi:hypothetical protein
MQLFRQCKSWDASISCLSFLFASPLSISSSASLIPSRKESALPPIISAPASQHYRVHGPWSPVASREYTFRIISAFFPAASRWRYLRSSTFVSRNPRAYFIPCHDPRYKLIYDRAAYHGYFIETICSMYKKRPFVSYGRCDFSYRVEQFLSVHAQHVPGCL